MNAIMKAEGPVGSVALVPSDIGSAMRMAEIMATGKLVPAHLQKSAGDCLMVIEAAMRWGMSPFAVAQETAVISGKLMFSGKLVSAAIHGSGVLSGRLRHDFEGEGEARAVVVSGTLRGEDTPRTIRCTLKEARTSNSMWTKQPDQQLVYFGTRAWARRHVPEVMLGVYSPEEMDEAPAEPFRGTTIDAKPEPAPAQESKPAAPPPESTPRPGTERRGRRIRDIIDDVRAAVVRATTVREVLAIGEGPDVAALMKHANSAVQSEVKALLAEAYAEAERREAAEDDAAEAEAETIEGEAAAPYDEPLAGEAFAGA